MSISLASEAGSGIIPGNGIPSDSAGRLQSVIDRIQAAGNVDEIIFETSRDICEIFNADRLTVYTLGDDKTSLTSRVKTGLDSWQNLKLPINEHSIAGFVGLHKQAVNFRDVYDRCELREQSEYLRFLQEVDKRTGYRTKQMLVVPILNAGDNDLLGVVQLINNKADEPFSQRVVDELSEICQA